MPPRGEARFEIRTSRAGEERLALISPDVCICADCLAELFDPRDRRYRYPFINCTNCGPRYTIITDIPYDRAATTMSRFPMCPACEREYDDPRNRRFHAQPNACWQCGPQVSLHDPGGGRIDCEDPIREAIALLQQGLILAVKGLGGFHLAVDAADDRAVRRLRRRKHREEKPLAVMVRDLEAARALVHIDAEEAGALLSRRRPIVLLRKRRSHGLSPRVAPRNRDLGVMLPYTPLHYLLMEGAFRALVMTSGNMTEEPITIDNRAAFRHLGEIADCFLVHDRDIHLRSDDSVVRVAGGKVRPIRRSRGFVPVPVFLSRELSELPAVLAVGAELKNTVCLTKDNRAFLSQHVGDMENLETFDFFRLTVAHLQQILEIDPQVVGHDLHPDYLSTRYAREEETLPVVAVQHHHAHIVSCLAENGKAGPVIGLALDGTGYGTDGRVWGGEVLLCDLVSFKRLAHLAPAPLPGGDAAARFPWRMALAYLHREYGEALGDLPLPFVSRLPEEAGVIRQMIRRGVNTLPTSSCGRLFDAVAALVGLRGKNAYEGQAAIELEMCRQRSGSAEGYPWGIRRENDPWILETAGIVRGVVEDLGRGAGRGWISARFHRTLIQLFGGACSRAREETGIQEVALSGGCFQNMTLLAGMTQSLEDAGFTVYSHRLVPTNDGCISLGQAVCAGLRHAGRRGAFE